MKRILFVVILISFSLNSKANCDGVSECCQEKVIPNSVTLIDCNIFWCLRKGTDNQSNEKYIMEVYMPSFASSGNPFINNPYCSGLYIDNLAHELVNDDPGCCDHYDGRYNFNICNELQIGGNSIMCIRRNVVYWANDIELAPPPSCSFCCLKS